MWDLIVEALVIILCTIGGAELIRALILFFVNVKTKEEYSYIILPISGNCEDAESRIRAAAARVRWGDSGGAHTVICLDCGMDEETKKICEKTACDYSIVTVLTKEEFESNPVFTRQN